MESKSLLSKLVLLYMPIVYHENLLLSRGREQLNTPCFAAKEKPVLIDREKAVSGYKGHQIEGGHNER
jgi:hypothetical protein